MVEVDAVFREDMRFLLALGVLVVGLLLGYLVGRANRRLLRAAGVDAAVEGTSFERTARSLGTSTIALFARLSSWFVYGVAVLLALHVAELLNTKLFWARATGFVPDLFLAVFALGVGFVVGDKAELIVGEYLRGIKLPEIGVVPTIVKYSVVYVAVLIALGQIGIATGALLLLFGVYAVGVIAVTLLALRDVLPAGAAGIYLLLSQPFSIGDTVEIDDRHGVVQEVSVFVTRIEADGREHIVPNHVVLREGVVLVRE